MTIQNAIKKVTKAFNVEPVKNGQFYSFTVGQNVIEFAQNGRSNEITCISTRRSSDKDDLMTDYFAGTFHDNITQAIKFIK
jgi:hypothetical protein